MDRKAEFCCFASLSLSFSQRGSVCSISNINRGIAGLAPLDGGSLGAALADMPGVVVTEGSEAVGGAIFQFLKNKKPSDLLGLPKILGFSFNS